MIIYNDDKSKKIVLTKHDNNTTHVIHLTKTNGGWWNADWDQIHKLDINGTINRLNKYGYQQNGKWK